MSEPVEYTDGPHRIIKGIIFILVILAVVLGVFSYLFRSYRSRPASLPHDSRRTESSAARAPNPGSGSGHSLRILAYSSLIGPWSAGPSLEREFAAAHPEIQLEWIDGGDSRAILQKLRSSVDTPEYDVVIGLDQFSVHEARSVQKWKMLSSTQIVGVTNPDSAATLIPSATPSAHPDFPWNPDLPTVNREAFEWQSFDWAPLTIVYREGEILPPHHLLDLAKTEFKGKLPWVDPRSSSVGFQFFAWAMTLNGFADGTTAEVSTDSGNKGLNSAVDFIRKLIPSRHSIAPNWSGAYGLFKKQEVPLAFSYLTSPVYHWKHENNREIKPAPLQDPLPFQVEYAGVPTNCRNCKEAQAFVQFLRTPSAQKILMNENYMLPVRGDIIPGTLFEELPHPQLLVPEKYEKIEPRQVIEVWNRLAS